MKLFFTLLFLAFSAFQSVCAQGSVLPKREFRGAWIQMINGQFQGMSRSEMQKNLTNQLNVMQRCGINAIIFQVRGEADAMYQSAYEPWTRFLSGRQGTLLPGWSTNVISAAWNCTLGSTPSAPRPRVRANFLRAIPT